MYQRKQVKTLLDRLGEDDPLIQVVVGPRQTGKSTMIAQALEATDIPAHSCHR